MVVTKMWQQKEGSVWWKEGRTLSRSLKNKCLYEMFMYMEVAWFHKCLGDLFFFRQNEHILKTYDGLAISPFEKTCLYLLLKLFLYKYFKCVVFKWVYLFTWNLEFDELHRCLTGVFLPMLREEKGLSDFF